MKIQLLYFEGCPNLEPARVALRAAITAEQIEERVEEIDVESNTAPESVRGWGSPTILIDGKDVTGATRTSGSSCRLYANGAPTVDEIRARLAAARHVPAGSSGRTTLSMLGAISAAIAASACCLVPAVLAAVGLSGAGFGAALAPYRLYFLGATAIALGVGVLARLPATEGRVRLQCAAQPTRDARCALVHGRARGCARRVSTPG